MRPVGAGVPGIAAAGGGHRGECGGGQGMTIRVAVDPTNPGQFFACCGLLELADRLWPEAEGWFDEREFCIARGGGLSELLQRLSAATVNSSLTDVELKRLGTLQSMD